MPATSREKRANRRYPIELDLQYKLVKRGRVEGTGVGRTVDISSGGILVETDRPLPPGTSVELNVKWPFLLRGVCAMKLIVRGRIVRCHGMSTTAAVRTDSHEFRTAGVRVTTTVNPGVVSLAEWKRGHAATAACR